VITGDVSGATATLLGTNYKAPGGVKYHRSDTHEGAVPSSPDVRLNYLHSGTQHLVDYWNIELGRVDERPVDHDPTGTGFQDWLWTYDYSGSDFTIASINGGNRFDYMHTNPDSVDFSNCTKALHHVNIGADWPGGINEQSHLRAQVSDVSHDDEIARVVIGDANTLAACTKLHVARSETWSSSSVSARLNYGEIPAGTSTYAYIYNNQNVCVNAVVGLLLGVAP